MAIAAATLLTATLLCTASPEINGSSPDLTISGGILGYHGKPFTGTLVQALEASLEIRKTPYLNGMEHGISTVTKQGRITEQRHYSQGKKHGTHRGWFADGKDRFYTEFTGDKYSGEHWTWHPNGKVAEFKKYTPDGQILVHKHWRESGQIYRNQVFAVAQNTESGMPGVKLCNTVKDTVGKR